MSRSSTFAASLLIAVACIAGTGATAPAAAADSCVDQALQPCNKRIVDAAFPRWEAGGGNPAQLERRTRR
ncbi:hypothetical protein LL965_11765 [Xanthomonas cassavae CFBP 4642]|uniref:Uncharacterized protein n=1 Tax=Xanthomonas cassavae CFBP 4642 TaxID=1219375 RepID=A0ABS8HHV4_9XANT|nr:hypothetical protein [Xanthomonas cassavae]MCC4620730.1 hypothetical protein [Xanthomonas cassavae CFBP 4642]